MNKKNYSYMALLGLIVFFAGVVFFQRMEQTTEKIRAETSVRFSQGQSFSAENSQIDGRAGSYFSSGNPPAFEIPGHAMYYSSAGKSATPSKNLNERLMSLSGASSGATKKARPRQVEEESLPAAIEGSSGGKSAKQAEVLTSNPFPSDAEIEAGIQDLNDKKAFSADLEQERAEQTQVVKAEIAKLSAEELTPPALPVPPPSSLTPPAEVVQLAQSDITTVH